MGSASYHLYNRQSAGAEKTRMIRNGKTARVRYLTGSPATAARSGKFSALPCFPRAPSLSEIDLVIFDDAQQGFN